MLRGVSYRALRAFSSFVLRLFYKVRVEGSDPAPRGAVIYVGNHPNALVDPGLLLAVIGRQLTMLAKAPLFKMPIIGWVLKAVDALPVYRIKDDPTGATLSGNKATVDQSTSVLVRGGALMLFPEGRSHSEPSLGELKSGAARMAQSVAQQGVPVRIVPIGIVYAEKHRFRSDVRVTFGQPLVVEAGTGAQAREVTEQINAALTALTLNLAQWEDLPLLQTAEALYALRAGKPAADPDRLRAFAQGVKVLREESPQELEPLQARLASFHRRLELVQATPEHLAVAYSPQRVSRFVLRNLLALLTGLPLFALGMAVFAIPFWIPWTVSRLTRAEWDMEGTVKLVTAIFVAPLWGAVIGWTVHHFFGTGWAVAAVIAALPLALFTRYFLERRAEAWRDTKVFFALVRRRRLKRLLHAEAEELSLRIEQAAERLRVRS